MNPQRRLRTAGSLALLLAVLSPLLPASLHAQQGAGVVDAALLLRRLDGVKRVLMIGAHPDDENSALLAALARGMGAETAYLSLTRGEGGQNLIGPELMEGLGLVRTGELLAARSIDGGRQYFTRALDYGFSKNAEEAFAHWPREELLRDVVWVVRSFRPQVIVSVFSGTPADGHGQHQAAGLMAREGFAAAGDPARFSEQLAHVAPWQPAKLFRSARGEGPDTPLTAVETGAFDPVLGRSWYQVAMEGRSRHRSQDMGAAQPLGSRSSSLVLVESTVPVAPGAELFAGVDTTLAGLTDALPEPARSAARARVDAYREAAHEAAESLGVVEPGWTVVALARALADLEALAALAAGNEGAGELARAVEHRTAIAQAALLAAAGVVVDVAAGDALLVPGEETTVRVDVWNGGDFPVTQAEPVLALPTGWSATPAPPPVPQGGRPGDTAGGRAPAEVAASGRVDPGEVASWSFRVSVPTEAVPTEPYFLRAPRDGDLYRWPDEPALWALPAAPPPIEAGARLALEVDAGEHAQVAALREAQFVGVDQGSGEYREPLLVVPALSVEPDQAVLVWPVGDDAPRAVAVGLRGEAAGGVEGSVRIDAPAGWTVEPASAPFALTTAGAVTSATFRVTPPPGAGAERVVLRAVAEDGAGRRWDRAVTIVDYPHIRRVARLAPAEVAVTRVAARVAQGLRVGYVMGTGDGGYEALRQLGVDAELLTPERVRAGDFAGFDAIVLGARAYETRPDLAAANARLLDFARAGGTVVVQYNQYQYPAGGFAPFPVEISRPHDRVTDETAPVRVLDPTAPVFTTPNRIADEDWAGWVHERGLYFLGEWDERFVPLLEMSDPGEAPLRGALLVAPVGEGLYVYTGLAFFRQFPAGVPGAYRLFANLVSLTAEDWARWSAAGGR